MRIVIVSLYRGDINNLILIGEWSRPTWRDACLQVLSCLLILSHTLSLYFSLSLRLSLSLSGSLDVKMAPKAVTLREETELQAMLDRLALDQEDVDGDEPEDN